MQINPKITFFIPDFESSIETSFISSEIKAGFPSPAADFEESKVSLDHLLIKNKEATFYAKASGNSMTGAGIYDGDILVIDRSIEPRDSAVAVCFIDGEFTVKRIKKTEVALFLMPENQSYAPIQIEPHNEFIIWGIVTYVIKQIK